MDQIIISKQLTGKHGESM